MGRSVFYVGLMGLKPKLKEIKSKLGTGSKIPQLAKDYKVPVKTMQHFILFYVLPTALTMR